MLHFECDYTQGAHPEVLRRLVETNMEATSGYGNDIYCASAKEKIKLACGKPDAEVFFLVGGTQTNATVIAAMLKSWQGVVSAETGHINVHEAGAIEYTDHKVITLKAVDGKISPETLKEYMEGFYADPTWTHMVEPGMVYISYPTEYGTIYSQSELDGIHDICKKYNIPLFIDGARLGYGLMAEGNDVTLESLAASCEAFYIGGTKVGTLFGEAVVFTDAKYASHFFTIMKQHGAVLAKGRLLGVQFDAMFTDDLYFKISKNAITMAGKLKKILADKGYETFIDSPTNQLFVTAPNSKLQAMEGKVAYDIWGFPDEEHTIVRFCTSWATSDEDIEKLETYL